MTESAPAHPAGHLIAGLTGMRKLFVLIGATVGGWLGWYAGAPVSMMVAFMVSMIGTGAGMYIGIKVAQRYS
jgi:hypothetical protein